MRVFSLALACSMLLAACGGKTAAPAAPPPGAPAGLSASGGSGQIALTWTAVFGASSYLILRGDAAGAEAALTPPATSTAANYTDSGLTAGKTYYYVVQARNAAGTSAKSNEASALTAPDAPAGLNVSTSDTSATVQWTASPGATDYVVLRAPGGTTTFSQVAATTTPGASDSGLTPNTSYVYAVRAHNASGTSANATFNAATAPVAPTFLSGAASNHHVTLTWTAAAGAGSGGYRVLRSTSASGPFTSVGTAPGTSFTDTFLTNNTPYSYVVHTIGGTGESGDSGSASATPFIEICTVDASSYAVSVFDGTASGNAPPKRSFGWSTGIAEGTGIGTDGTNLFVASKYTQTVNVYPRATVSGDQPPARKISLTGQPSALTVSGTDLYVAFGAQINVYHTSDTGSPTPYRTLTTPGGGTVSGIQVFSGTTNGGATVVNQTFVVSNNNILVYANGASGTTPPLTTIIPATTSAGTRLVGPAYDSVGDAIFVGWLDGFGLTAKVASYPRGGSGVTNPVQPPLTSGTFNPYFDNAIPGGIVVDGADLWVVIGSQARSALVKYALATATAGAQPAGGFFGSLTRIYKPGPLVLDAGSNELWFVNGKDGASGYLKTATSGNHAPAHVLLGDATGLYDPEALAADRPGAEIVILNQAPGHAISVYPSASTTAVFTRQIVGPLNTTLNAMSPTFLSIDEANREYWVDDRSSNNGFAAFAATAGGDTAPVRSIARDVSLGAVGSIYYDAKAAQIVALANVATGSWTSSGWNRTRSGNVPADRSATVAAATATNPAVDFLHDLLFVTTDAGLDVFPRAFPGGALTPTSVVDDSAVGAALGAVDDEGNELYYRLPGKILVAPRPSGSALSLARTITGSATGLYNLAGLAICN